MLQTRALAGGVPRYVPLAAIDWVLLTVAASLALVAFWPERSGGGDPLAAIYRDRVAEVAQNLGGDAQAQHLAVIVLGAQPLPAEGQTGADEEVESW